MILATIKSGNHDLTLKIPFEREKLAQSLSEMGIREPPGGFFLRDEPGKELSVKLDTTENIFSFEHRLIALFDRNTSLREANSLCKLVLALPDSLREQLNTDMRAGTVSDGQELISRLQTLRKTVCEDFLCPLAVQQIDDDTNEYVDAGKWMLVQHEDEIREALYREMHPGENMADYYDGAGCGKIRSILWDVEEDNGALFGCVHVYASEPFTPVEKAELIDWITGQNSDGFGEGFEQHPVDTDEGDLYVSFWNSDGSYFVKDREDFEQDQQNDAPVSEQKM